MSAMPDTTETTPRRIPVALLREAEHLRAVQPGDVILGKDGEERVNIVALSGGVAALDAIDDARLDLWRVHLSEIDHTRLRTDDILRLADWLRARGHRLQEER